MFVGNASCWDFAHLQVCGLKNAEHLNGQTARRVDLHIIFTYKGFRCLEYSNPTANIIFLPAFSNQDCELQSCEWPMGGAF